ncbi:type II secretion system protein [bacterium]|nr:type II secretion system protein [bacterium]
MNKIKKLIAFTLAETLIVMGIIGVVAALTIPNVNKNTSNMEKVTRFKKIYAELNEALDRATAVYGPIETWYQNIPESAAAKKFTDRLTEFMKVNKSYSCLSDETFDVDEGGSSCVIFANGASIIYCFNCDYFFIDIDGPNKGKNELGIDRFFLGGYDDGYHDFIHGITASSVSPSEFRNDATYCFKYKGMCGQWILDNGNMDYLNADRDGKCKNDTSKVLGYGEGKVQSCK